MNTNTVSDFGLGVKPDSAKITVKTGIYQKKILWKVLPAGAVRAHAACLNYRNGAEGLWLAPVLDTGEFWTVFDVEDPEHHSSITANIEAALQFLYFLKIRSLSDGLQIILTGRAFRFALPYAVPAKLKREFLLFLKEQPGIDDAIQKKRDPVPFRMFAYRSKTQDKDNLCRKSVLISPELLEVTTEEYYLTLTSGQYSQLELKRIPGWTESILPTQPLPQPWLNFLGEYSEALKYKDLIFRKFKKPKNHEEYRKAVLSYLARGVDHRELDPDTTGALAALHQCPQCGQKSKAYVSKSGYVKCFRGSCVLSEGMRFSEVFADFEYEYKPEYAENGTDTPKMALSQARETNVQVVRSGLESGTDTLLISTPGTGKTYAAISEVLKIAENRIVAIAAPTLNLCREIYHQALSMSPGNVNIKLLEGRNRQNCIKPDLCESVANRGFSPGLTLCVSCSEKETCLYFKQFEGITDGLCICTHHLSVWGKIKPEVFIIDENPLNALLNETSAGTKNIFKFRNHINESFFGKLEKCLNKAQKQVRGRQTLRIYAGDKAPGQWERCHNLAELSGINGSDIDRLFESLAAEYLQRQIKKPTIKHKSLVAYVNALFSSRIKTDGALQGRKSAASSRIKTDGALQGRNSVADVIGISYRDAAAIHSFLKTSGFITVRGNSSYPIYDRDQILAEVSRRPESLQLFQLESKSAWQQRLMELKVNMNALNWLRTVAEDKEGLAYVQVGSSFATFNTVSKREIEAEQLIILDGTGDAEFYSGLMGRQFQEHRVEAEMPDCMKVLISCKLGKTKAGERSDSELNRLLKKCVPYIRAARNILLVTFLDIEARLLELAKKQWPGKEIDSTHYYASRGLNNWEDSDCVICVGVPNPNQLEAFNAATLAFDSQKDIEKHISGIAENELIQCIHRIRPVFGGKTICQIGNFFPGEKPHIIESADLGDSEGYAIMRAAEICMEFYTKHGFLTPPFAYCLGVGENLKRVRTYHSNLKKTGIPELAALQSEEFIIFNGRQWFGNISRLIEKDLGKQPRIKSDEGTWKRKWTNGIGTVKHAEIFCKTYINEFRRKNWKQL